MAFKAKLLIDEYELNVLHFSFNLEQASDVTGRPSQKPIFKQFRVIFESQKEADFTQWMISSGSTKQIELHIYPRIEGNRIRKIKFYDVHLVGLQTNFDSEGAQPLSETLTMTVGGLKDSVSNAEYEASWRVTFDEAEVAATTIDEEPELIRYYITDLEGNEIEKYKISDKILLNLETKNAIGKILTVSIPDKVHDFKHNGIALKNDTLKNYTINSDLEQIELEVIAEQTQA